MILANIDLSQQDLCFMDENIKGSEYDGARTLHYLKENGARKVLIASGESPKDIASDPAFAAMDGFTTEKVPMSLGKYLN